MSGLRTERLLLRTWTDADRGPQAAMNADAEVMRFFPSVMDRASSDAWYDRLVAHWAEHGFGPYAVEDVAGFVGFVGLLVPSFEPPFRHRAEPAVEIGWRLLPRAWGQGYAVEAATAVLGQAFGDLALPEVLSFTVPDNERSRAVMRRLGMTHDPDDDFDHPRLPADSPLSRHVLYRLSAERFATLSR